MYSRKHGSSGSSKPYREEPPEWVDMDKEEVKEKIVELGQEGKEPSEIGEVLRDQYGIPSVKDFGMKITEILEKEDLRGEIPEDLRKLVKKSERIREHLGDQPRDSSAIHGLEQTESKIRRLTKYYKKEGKIPQDWKHETEKEFHKRK
ncbi:MAG: 30S ribosomal protein S15 [Candidatus Aenigmatarchaeota archaeon]